MNGQSWKIRRANYVTSISIMLLKYLIIDGYVARRTCHGTDMCSFESFDDPL